MIFCIEIAETDGLPSYVKKEGVMLMSTYEALALMIAFGTLITLIIKKN